MTLKMAVLKHKNDIIDVRSKSEFKENSIAGVKNIPMFKLVIRPKKYLEKNHRYYIMCQSGSRAGQVVAILSKKGYDVINVGGISNY